MLPIKQKFIQFNYNSGRNGNQIKYITIHDTGNTGIGANTTAHYNFFNGGDRQASAHYFVDDGNIVQTVSDNDTSWHCGDGKGAYGITNANSIGVEICINADGDYNKSLTHTIDLVKHLMNKYKIGIDNVVRHYDASRKMCPFTMSAINWTKWYEFKNQLTSNTPIPVVEQVIYRVQIGAFTVESYAKAYLENLKALGINGFMVTAQNLYRIQVGAFTIENNAKAYMEKLKKENGIDGFIVKN